MQNHKHYQVAIVGASIAGASLAKQLAEAGIDIILIDKAEFPRSKPCGEGLSNLACELLCSVGLEEAISSIDKYPLYGYEIHQENDFRILADDPSPCAPSVWGIRRHELDSALLDQLKDHPNVRIVLGTALSEVVQEHKKYKMNLSGEIFTSDYLVLADGGKSKLATKLNVPKISVQNSLRYGCTFYLEGKFNKSLDRVVIFIEDSREIFCTRLAVDKLNISFLCSKEISSDLRSEKGYLDLIQVISERIGFVPRIISKPLMTGPCGFQSRASVFNRTMLIGDACEQLDPVGGMGMTHALVSSICAADALTACIEGKLSEEEAFEQYESRREMLVQPLRGFSRLSFIALVSHKNLYCMKMLRSSFLARMMNRLVHGSSESVLMSLIGKNVLRIIGAKK